MFNTIVKNLLRRGGFSHVKGPAIAHANLLNVMELAVRALYPQDDGVTCVQIGANDCASNDPFIPLIKPGWQAVLVEPQPPAAERLEQKYAGNPNVRIDRCLIAAEEGESTLYYIARRDDLSPGVEGVASMSREHVLHYAKHDESRIGEVKVPAITLAHLLANYDLNTLDILAIDAEGFDYEILRTIDFNQIRPGIVLYEHFHLSYDDAEASVRLLVDQGYQLIRVGFDFVAVQKQRLQNPIERS